MTIIESIEAEYQRYKALAEAAIQQLTDAELIATSSGGGNSIAVICWHISGNLRSRFTDFLTSDGEKPWRHREEEFAAREVHRDELLAKWNEGWAVLFDTLATLTDDDLHASVTIRGEPFPVHEALHRLMAHASYHVGQIVYIAKSLRGNDWQYLSIPPGQSTDYTGNPALEHGAAHASALRERLRR